MTQKNIAYWENNRINLAKIIDGFTYKMGVIPLDKPLKFIKKTKKDYFIGSIIEFGDIHFTIEKQ